MLLCIDIGNTTVYFGLMEKFNIYSDYVVNYLNKDIIHDKNLIFYGLNKLYKNSK